MRLFPILRAALLALTGGSLAPAADPGAHPPQPAEFVLHSGGNAGIPAPLDSSAQGLAARGYTGLIGASIQGAQTFDAILPGLLPEGSPERAFALARQAAADRAIADAHKAGLKIYAPTDLLVFPKALVARFRDEICAPDGRFDIHRPKTAELFRALLRESLDRFPDIDGILVRTGEVYLHSYPHHAATAAPSERRRQGASAILRGPDTHAVFARILREEVCEKRGKTVIYRTWDFGQFHEKPDYYLAATRPVPPHPQLLFSVKHQRGDFHRLTPFNPTLGIGEHRQIVEVQAQMEAYGKGAHPYYIGQGVIEGWEEYQTLMRPGEPKGLRDFIGHPLCAGVWVWSRGGGWEGPEITDGLWPDLNAYVVSQFARDPARSEAEHFDDFAKLLGLSDSGRAAFRKLNLLSAQAVLRGQLTLLPAEVDEWWARDHFLAEVDLSDFLRKKLTGPALAEKAEAVAMWDTIVAEARKCDIADPRRQRFAEISARYGRIKYALFEQAWTILLLGRQSDARTPFDRARLARAIASYDKLWAEWRELEARNPECSTIYREVGFERIPGLGAAVNRYRKLAKP